MKNIRVFFIWKVSFSFVVKLSVYLNRHVFVMHLYENHLIWSSAAHFKLQCLWIRQFVLGPCHMPLWNRSVYATRLTECAGIDVMTVIVCQTLLTSCSATANQKGLWGRRFSVSKELGSRTVLIMEGDLLISVCLKVCMYDSEWMDGWLYIYHIVAWIPNIQHEISRDVDDLHACKCDKSVIPWFCACTCDNALAHASWTMG